MEVKSKHYVEVVSKDVGACVDDWVSVISIEASVVSDTGQSS